MASTLIIFTGKSYSDGEAGDIDADTVVLGVIRDNIVGYACENDGLTVYFTGGSHCFSLPIEFDSNQDARVSLITHLHEVSDLRVSSGMESIEIDITGIATEILQY